MHGSRNVSAYVMAHWRGQCRQLGGFTRHSAAIIALRRKEDLDKRLMVLGAASEPAGADEEDGGGRTDTLLSIWQA